MKVTGLATFMVIAVERRGNKYFRSRMANFIIARLRKPFFLVRSAYQHGQRIKGWLYYLLPEAAALCRDGPGSPKGAEESLRGE